MIKTRDTIIIAIVACISLLVSLSTHSGSKPVDVYRIKTLLQDASIHFDTVEKIDIHRDGLRLVFENIDGAWWQQLPFPMRMNPASMLALIEATQGVQVLGELGNNQSIEGIGLGDGADSIELFDGLTTITIRLGRKTLGGRAYASIGSGMGVLVDQSLHNRALDMDHRLWRDSRVFPDFAIDAVRIENEVDGNRLLLERYSGRWEMREPVSTRVNQNMLLVWVGELAAARVGSFVVDEPTDLHLFGLDTPSAIFEVGDRQGNAHKVLVGGRVSAGSQDRYMMLADRPVIFSMKWETLSKLFPLAELLIDATGSGVSRFDVKQVTIQSQGRQITLQRDLDRWINTSQRDVIVDLNEVDALLYWALDATPLSVAIGQYPIELEVATISFAGYDLSPIDTVRIAKNLEGEWILENGDNVLRLHPPESGETLDPFIN